MSIRKDARLHIEGIAIRDGDQLHPGDIVSLLPGLWSNIGIVCRMRENMYINFFDLQDKQKTFYQSLFDVDSFNGQRFVVIPGAAIVPFIDSDTFDIAHPGRNGIALIEEKLACVGWSNHSYFLFDAKDGTQIDRIGSRPVFISSWDILTKDVDDAVISLLEVRPD